MGLKSGVYQFKFAIDTAFFALFEGSPIEEGKVEFVVDLDKRSDMLLFDFELTGFIKAECDRCTAQIDLPIEDSRQLIVKYGEDEDGLEDEVVFISREASEFNVAKYLYEFAVLAMPITNTYDCQEEPNPPCNFEVLKHLGSDGEKDGPTVWDVLKEFDEE
jgi:uncharacterized metal-binding protein YceD (DUF177 family)